MSLIKHPKELSIIKARGYEEILKAQTQISGI
jgi:hypothetical protein